MGPVWLLDVDGVVNAVDDDPDPAVWPDDQWIRTEASSRTASWPMLAARPVCDFLRAVHRGGYAEIRWHTSWQRHANNVSKALHLPDFPIQPCPEFDAAIAAIGGRRPIGRTWWKLPAAQRVLMEEHRRLIWTDDDARRELRSGQARALRASGSLLISPPTHAGLSPRHLRRIATYLQMPA